MKQGVFNAVVAIASCAAALIADRALSQTIERVAVVGDAPFTVEAVASESDVFVGMVLIERLGGSVPYRRLADGTLELLPSLHPELPSVPLAVSGDGMAVAGWASTPDGNVFVMWIDGAIHQLSPVVAPLSFPSLHAIGGNRTVGAANLAIGDGNYLTPLVEWNGLAGPTILPGHFETPEVFVGLSGNGTVLTSNTSTPVDGCSRIVRRQSGGGSTVLPLPEGCGSAWAESVSADGQTVVGWGVPFPCPGEGGGDTFAPPFLTDNIAFLWPEKGIPVAIPLMEGASSATFVGVSNGGGIAIGSAFVEGPNGPQSTGFIWTPAGGMRPLQAELAVLGVDLEGWSDLYAGDISADGNRIHGWGRYNGGDARFIAQLGPDLNDSDGDGICNDWEVNGIPYVDSLGDPQRYTLPQANPHKKNLWVEVDTMAGVNFGKDASDMVKAAFANAPLQNPDRSTGVILHVLHDETDLPLVDPWMTDGSPGSCWPADFYAVADQHFGTHAEAAGPGGQELFLAKAKAFRYCIAARRSGPTNWGGCGEQPGDNFVVFLPEGQATIHTAAVFMHELGHNLGLGHGGCDNINGKPNYPSIMNYVHSYRYDWNAAFWRLDYSRAGSEEFASLDESQLDELAGIGNPDGLYWNWLAPFGYTEFPFNSRAVAYVTLDGFPHDFGSPDKSLIRDGALSLSQQDLNWKSVAPGAPLPTAPSFPQVLHPCNDWNHLVLATRAVQGAALGPPQYPTDELTWEDVGWINANFPKPPTRCGMGDFNCDGNVNGADLGVLLSEWGTCPGCQADLNRDGVVSGPDLGILLAAWGTVR